METEPEAKLSHTLSEAQEPVISSVSCLALASLCQQPDCSGHPNWLLVNVRMCTCARVTYSSMSGSHSRPSL